jgi:hypothetical protein
MTPTSVQCQAQDFSYLNEKSWSRPPAVIYLGPPGADEDEDADAEDASLADLQAAMQEPAEEVVVDEDEDEEEDGDAEEDQDPAATLQYFLGWIFFPFVGGKYFSP